MKKLDKIPNEGQFVAFWEFDGFLWSSTYRYEGGELLRYNEGSDEERGEWNECKNDIDFLKSVSAEYIVTGEKK